MVAGMQNPAWVAPNRAVAERSWIGVPTTDSSISDSERDCNTPISTPPTLMDLYNLEIAVEVARRSGDYLAYCTARRTFLLAQAAAYCEGMFER